MFPVLGGTKILRNSMSPCNYTPSSHLPPLHQTYGKICLFCLYCLTLHSLFNSLQSGLHPNHAQQLLWPRSPTAYMMPNPMYIFQSLSYLTSGMHLTLMTTPSSTKLSSLGFPNVIPFWVSSYLSNHSLPVDFGVICFAWPLNIVLYFVLVLWSSHFTHSPWGISPVPH